MKFLIWVFVLLIPSILTTMLKKAGIFLGAIPTILLYGGAYLLAKFLCAKWDVKSFVKEAQKHGMTPGAYASSIFPPSLLDLCEENKNDKVAFRNILTQSVNAETITKAEANVLLRMFDFGGWY